MITISNPWTARFYRLLFRLARHIQRDELNALLTAIDGRKP